jgi:serine/threonine protein phosphatase PrpC
LVDEERIAVLLRRDPHAAVQGLLRAALDAGGTDNVTAVVVRVETVR